MPHNIIRILRVDLWLARGYYGQVRFWAFSTEGLKVEFNIRPTPLVQVKSDISRQSNRISKKLNKFYQVEAYFRLNRSIAKTPWSDRSLMNGDAMNQVRSKTLIFGDFFEDKS